jgi:hypothetical protein
VGARPVFPAHVPAAFLKTPIVTAVTPWGVTRAAVADCLTARPAFVTADGGKLCAACVLLESEVHAATVDPAGDPQWRVIGAQAPDPGDACDHCGSTL